MKLRFAATSTGSEAPARVDRDRKFISGVSLLQIGEALGHGMQIDETMLRQVADLTNQAPGGLKSRFTHPGMCADGMGRMLGRVSNARVQGDKVIGDLQLAQHAHKTPDGDLASYVMDLAEQDPGAFGLSIAFSGTAVWKLADGTETPAFTAAKERIARPASAVGAHPFARVTTLRAVDVVDEPAANREGLFGELSEELTAAFSETSNAVAEEAFAELDRMRESLGLSTTQVTAFLGRYIAARQPEDIRMDPIKFSALIDANPSHAVALSKAFAAGNSEEQMTVVLAEAQRAAADTALRAELAAAVTTRDTLIAELAAEKAAHKAALAQSAKLSALGVGAVDPGSSPSPTIAPSSDAEIKAQWAAMPREKQAVFLFDIETYRYHLNDRAADKAASGKE